MAYQKITYVTKFDGSMQPFDRQKIVRTCLRMRATPEIAQLVAEKVESQAYDGIHTKKILQLIFANLRKYKPEVKHIIDLRTAISMLRPKPDFEIFIAQLLRAYGYKVRSNEIIAGRCIEHEIDAIAEKQDKNRDVNEIIYVEVKHHFNPHTFTGLDVFLSAWASFEDLEDGCKSGVNKIKFNKALVVSNTKLSDHSRHYADCRGIAYIGWNAPADRGLERMIEEKQLQPVTLMRGLDAADEAKLGDAGIVTLKQILELDIEELWERTRIPKKTLKEYKSKAQKILSA